MSEIRIVSGGQTGVDRAALDAALQAGIACGGWCPEGRKAEDGRIPEAYPLTELAKGGYPERTLQNVMKSDATVIIYFGKPTGGTALTIEFCHKEGKPYLLIDAERLSIQAATERIGNFVSQHRLSVLNVAGPRASGVPGAYDYAYQVISKFLPALA
jgi:hypothetical protein